MIFKNGAEQFGQFGWWGDWQKCGQAGWYPCWPRVRVTACRVGEEVKDVVKCQDFLFLAFAVLCWVWTRLHVHTMQRFV